MDTQTILNDATGRMQKAIDHLEEELLNVRAGKASPNALNGVMVDYFGSQVPVSGAASVTVHNPYICAIFHIEIIVYKVCHT